MFYNNFNTILEYIWIGGNDEIRSKTRVLNIAVNKNIDMPYWNYDGSSTGQIASSQSELGTDSEIFLKPLVIYLDPFIRDMKSYLVWCSTYIPDGSVLSN
jgi:glutamine synthetase